MTDGPIKPVIVSCVLVLVSASISAVFTNVTFVTALIVLIALTVNMRAYARHSRLNNTLYDAHMAQEVKKAQDAGYRHGKQDTVEMYKLCSNSTRQTPQKTRQRNDENFIKTTMGTLGGGPDENESS